MATRLFLTCTLALALVPLVSAQTKPAHAEPWRAAFDEAYGLSKDQALRHVPPPYIPERLDFYKWAAKAQEILNQASAQGLKMIEEARAAAAKVQETETQKAIAAATDIVTKARQATEAEHARMLAELRREVGRLVVTTTGKVTGKVLTPDDQNRLAEEANRQLAA